MLVLSSSSILLSTQRAAFFFGSRWYQKKKKKRKRRKKERKREVISPRLERVLVWCFMGDGGAWPMAFLMPERRIERSVARRCARLSGPQALKCPSGAHMCWDPSGNNGGSTLGDDRLGLKISRLFLTLEWCLKSWGHLSHFLESGRGFQFPMMRVDVFQSWWEWDLSVRCDLISENLMYFYLHS